MITIRSDWTGCLTQLQAIDLVPGHRADNGLVNIDPKSVIVWTASGTDVFLGRKPGLSDDNLILMGDWCTILRDAYYLKMRAH